MVGLERKAGAVWLDESRILALLRRPKEQKQTRIVRDGARVVERISGASSGPLKIVADGTTVSRFDEGLAKPQEDQAEATMMPTDENVNTSSSAKILAPAVTSFAHGRHSTDGA